MAVATSAPCAGLMTVAVLLASAAPAAAQATGSYNIEAIDVTGVTVVDAAKIERAVYPFTGPGRSNDDIEKARAAVQAVYAAEGYEAVIVELPPQDPDLLRQGVITVRVSEAPVARVRVVDSRYHSLANVRAQVPSVEVGKPLNLKALQRDLEAANRYPDREVTPSFKPGLVPGTVEVDLRVRSTYPLHASVELNDDASPNTTDLRLNAQVRYTDLWNAGHSVSFSYAVAPEDRTQQEVFSASYTAPIIGTPWSILVYGYTSNSNVAAFGGTNVLGNGYQVGVRGIYRLPSALYQTFSFGVDYKDFAQDIFVGDVVASSAPVHYIPFTAEYSVAKETENTSLDATIGATMGLRVIKDTVCLDQGANAPCIEDDQFTNREVNSQENFFRFNASLNFTAATKDDFVGAIRASAQLADSHLVTNEQYAIGGLTSVRGYYLSEGVGDEGLNLGLEARLPSFAGRIGGPLDELRVFGFTDLGYVRIRDPLPQQDGSFTLFSAGGGIRIRLFDHLSGEAILAVPLIDGPITGAGTPRFTFSAKGQF